MLSVCEGGTCTYLQQIPESKVISLDERGKGEEKLFLEELLQDGARKLLQAAIENEVIDYIQFHKDRRDENGQRLVVRKSLFAILRASHRAHCVDHLGVKRGETIRNMG